jgi:hypothetical protein
LTRRTSAARSTTAGCRSSRGPSCAIGASATTAPRASSTRSG